MNLMNYPGFVLAASCLVLWLAAEAGSGLHSLLRPVDEEDRDDFGLVANATLTLLALLIGFTFSMAVSRYDQRKNYEAEEANAIGTEYARTDLLASDATSKTRHLLQRYLDERVLFYITRDRPQLQTIDRDTANLQNELWRTILPDVSSQPTAVNALVVSGMNDVLNSQAYTQAAWLNRIPIAAWCLMATVAICCNLLIGYRARHRDRRILLILPITVSIAFFLISDIDSARGGAIRVAPHNLELLSQSLRVQ